MLEIKDQTQIKKSVVSAVLRDLTETLNDKKINNRKIACL